MFGWIRISNREFDDRENGEFPCTIIGSELSEAVQKW